MDSVATLLHEVQQLGVTVALSGDSLVLKGSLTKIPEQTQKALTARKGEIVAYLNGEPITQGVEECPDVEEIVVTKRQSITYQRITSAELDSGDFELEYLIPGVMVAQQPMIIAGPKKSLKTSFIVDLAVSLSHAGHFLGYFKVERAAKVCVMSGESGLATLQETARRVSKAAGVKLSDLSTIWSPDLPRFDALDYLDALEGFLQEDEIEVLIVDPAYLAMPAADAGNLMAQGELLRNITATCARVGVQMVLVHHTKKHRVGERFDPLSLEDIAWAGFQEFARQWLLINHREEYEAGSGEHRMWLSTGGSAGHGGLYGVDVSEGLYPNRTWDVSVSTGTNAKKEAQKRQQDRKAKEQEEKENQYRLRLKTALQRFPEGETQSVLSQISGLNSKAFSTAIAALKQEGRVEPCRIRRANKHSYDGWKYVEPGIHSDTQTDSDTTQTETLSEWDDDHSDSPM